LSDSAATNRLVHPGTATLRFAGVEVEVKLSDQLTGGRFDAEEADVFVPYRRAVRPEVNAEQAFDDAESDRREPCPQ
jgi:hypothetical protein